MFLSQHSYLADSQSLLDFSYSRERLASGAARLSAGHF